MTDQNLLVSPLSAQMLLGILATAGNEAAQQEIAELLGCDDISALNSLNHKLATSLNQLDKDVVASLANSAWYDQSLQMSASFASDFSTAYNGHISQCDMHQHATVDKINKWCADNTDNQIPEIIDNIPEDLKAIFANAMHFDGLWKYPFSPEMTKKETFHNVNGDTEVEMMKQASHFGYFKTGNAQGVRLPFGNGTFMATFAKPVNTTVDNLINTFSPADCEYVETLCALSLPKCSVPGAELKLKNILTTQFNIQHLFQPDAITAFTPYLSVYSISQKSAVEFSETGGKASSVTWSGLETSTGEPTHIEEVTFDSPFLFYITERQTGTCLIAGKVVKL